MITKFLVAPLMLVTYVGTSIASVPEEEVNKWVASALEYPATDADIAKSLKKPWSQSDVYRAWKQLKGCRDAGRSLDLSLASAEHYLFIRSFAFEKGEKDIEELPKLYGDVKRGLGPAANLLKTSTQPVSPVDPDVIAWGEKGVKDGLADYFRVSKKLPKEKSGTYHQYKLAVQGYYDNYYQSKPSTGCNVKLRY